MAADKRINKKTLKRDKPTITKKALERLVTINNGGPINNIKRSGSEEPEFSPSPSALSSTLTSRPKGPSPNARSTASTSQGPDEAVTNVRAAIQKPKFDFAALRAQSSVMGSLGTLPDFLKQMEVANKELEEERRLGTLKQRRMEIDDDETSSSGSSDDKSNDDDGDSDGDEEMADARERKRLGKERKERRQYIEMNLGLGVLEEKGSDDSSSESEQSEDEGMGVMNKLKGAEEERNTAKIEVVKET